MDLSLDADRGVRTERCADCSADYRCVTGFVVRGQAPVAVYYAALHGHDGPHEAWLDVTLAEGAVAAEAPRVTFACRIGDFGSHGGLGAALVDVGLDHGGDGLPHPEVGTFGRRLTAEEALGHRRLEDFWSVVDLLLEADPDVHAHTRTAPGA